MTWPNSVLCEMLQKDFTVQLSNSAIIVSFFFFYLNRRRTICWVLNVVSQDVFQKWFIVIIERKVKTWIIYTWIIHCPCKEEIKITDARHSCDRPIIYYYRNPRQSCLLDSTQWIPDSRQWIPDLCQCSLDSGFQSLAEFWIPRAVWRIQGKPRIPDSTSKNVPDSGIRIPLHGAIGTNNDG